MQGEPRRRAGHDHLGADLLHRRRGDHDADHRLALRPLRPQASCSSICVVGFVVASVLCGTAFGLDEMVVFRILQGVFGAALVPLSQAVLLDINPREQHGQAMAIWGVGIMVGADHRADARRLADRQLQLALGVLHQPAGRHPRASSACSLFMPETRAAHARAFDFFGFAMLSLAIGALQLMLDRGDRARLVRLDGDRGRSAARHRRGLDLPRPHRDRPASRSSTARLFIDRNFSPALVFIFVVGIVLLATMALLPPMLQNLMGYPVITVGLVLAPRGVGTMISMMVVGRLVGKVDARLLVLFGLSLTALSLWQMTFFAVGMDSWPLIISGVIQGFGLGFVFVPLSTIAFATLDPQLRTEAIRPVQPGPQHRLVDRHLDHGGAADSQHADQPRRRSPRRSPCSTRTCRRRHQPDAAHHPGRRPDRGPARRPDHAQSLMIAYLDDFKAMFVITLCAAPLLLLLRYKKLARAGAASAGPPAAAIAAAGRLSTAERVGHATSTASPRS